MVIVLGQSEGAVTSAPRVVHPAAGLKRCGGKADEFPAGFGVKRLFPSLPQNPMETQLQ